MSAQNGLVQRLWSYFDILGGPRLTSLFVRIS